MRRFRVDGPEHGITDYVLGFGNDPVGIPDPGSDYDAHHRVGW